MESMKAVEPNDHWWVSCNRIYPETHVHTRIGKEGRRNGGEEKTREVGAFESDWEVDHIFLLLLKYINSIESWRCKSCMALVMVVLVVPESLADRTLHLILLLLKISWMKNREGPGIRASGMQLWLLAWVYSQIIALPCYGRHWCRHGHAAGSKANGLLAAQESAKEREQGS